MKKIVIKGGPPICGDLKVSGSKNAVLPLIFASILTDGVSVFNNVPDIGDVRVAIELISELGAETTFADNRLTINTESLKYTAPSPHLISRIRASTYLMGASLARFGKAEIGEFGGCNFSHRPIDLHIKSAIALSSRNDGNHLVTNGLKGAKIYLEKPSVGATVNTLIMAAMADGETEIHGYAKEPHVLALADYLNKTGLYIKLTDEKITVRKSQIRPIEYDVIGDMVEAGSYIAAAALTNGDLTVSGFDTADLKSFFDILSLLGYEINTEEKYAHICSKKRNARGSIAVTAAPFPSFPTDLQPILSVLLAKNSGGKIIDTVWQARFGYLASLAPFGIRFERIENGAEIRESAIKAGKSTATDLRGGMACVLAALSAKGTSEILSADLILRGYDRLEEKLSSVGVDVKILDM